MKLVTRSALGWGPSAAPTQTSTKGVKVHYEGSPVSTKLLADHNACIAEWKAIRASHLANTKENYSDIAYNYGACPHGYLLEGRGLGKRTGANGNQPLNIAHYAIVGLVGSEGLTKPTDAMLNAIRDGIDLLRQHGAGTEIKGHRDGYATECPGPALYTWVQAGAPRPATEEDDMPLNAADLEAIRKAVWETDKIASPADAPDHKTNATWQAQSYLKDTNARVRTLSTAVAGLTATVKTLAGQLGQDVDTAAVVAAVEKAIAEATVKVSVDVSGPTS